MHWHELQYGFTENTMNGFANFQSVVEYDNH